MGHGGDTERIRAAGLIGLGDRGYVGLAEVVVCPFQCCGKPQWKKDAHAEHAKPHSSTGAPYASYTAVRKEPERSPALCWYFSSEKQGEKGS